MMDTLNVYSYNCSVLLLYYFIAWTTSFYCAISLTFLSTLKSSGGFTAVLTINFKCWKAVYTVTLSTMYILWQDCWVHIGWLYTYVRKIWLWNSKRLLRKLQKILGEIFLLQPVLKIILLHRLTVSSVWAVNIVRRPCSVCSHITAPYKLSFINGPGVNVLSAAYLLPL